MTFKKMILSGTLALGLIGCGGDDGAPPVVTCDPTGDSYSYLVNSLVLDDAMDGTSAGFNLDGVATSTTDGALDLGCAKQDFTGVDGVTGGIDNQIGPLLGALAALPSLPNVQDVIDEAINSGQALILANVDFVDSLTSDDCVGMGLVTGLPIDPPLDPATMLDGTEAIEIDPTSLDDNGDPLISAEGEIVAGVLTATDLTMALDVPFAYMGDTIPISLTVNDATLEADITATDLTNGNIGGSITEDDLAALATDLLAVVAPETDPSTILPILAGFLDIHVEATPGSAACDAISAGIVFNAVEAQNVTYP